MLFYQAERDRTLKDEQQQQEEALALQLEKTKLQELRDEKMRQQIRETRWPEILYAILKEVTSQTVHFHKCVIRVGRFKSARFKSLILITIKITWFLYKNHWLKSKRKNWIFCAKKTIINYRNHWQNVKIMISVHLGPPHPGLSGFNDNVLRDLTLHILGDVFTETLIIHFGNFSPPELQKEQYSG